MMACVQGGERHASIVHPGCGCCTLHCECFPRPARLARGQYELLRALEREAAKPSPYFPVCDRDPVRRQPEGVTLVQHTHSRRRA